MLLSRLVAFAAFFEATPVNVVVASTMHLDEVILALLVHKLINFVMSGLLDF